MVAGAILEFCAELVNNIISFQKRDYLFMVEMCPSGRRLRTSSVLIELWVCGSPMINYVYIVNRTLLKRNVLV